MKPHETNTNNPVDFPKIENTKNERIRELALAVFSFKYKTNPNELNPGHHMDHIHKFAELIVQECMDICKQHPSRIVSNNWNGDAVAPHLVKEFKEHFGIK